MTESELAKVLAEYQGKGYVIAPAGFGKTHLIAMAIKLVSSRQLILTHTFAGVNALKKKMQTLGVSASKYQIDTIASWSLRLCLAYPKNSGWNIDSPNQEQWNQLYEASSFLLTKEFVKKIILATYSGVYVDEYQDCSNLQHKLTTALAEILPCRILGDPMQAIFDFNDEPVSWEESVYPSFACLGELKTPWRWNNAGADSIGNWLMDVRADLKENGKINLSENLPKNVFVKAIDLDDFMDANRLKPFYDLANKCKNETVVVIYPGAPQFKNKTHTLARNLAGQYSSIEEVEGTALFSFIKKVLKAKTSSVRLKTVLDFAKDCMTSVTSVLPAGTVRFEVAKISKSTKYPELAEAANNYYNNPSSQTLKLFLGLLKNNSETRLFRRDLFNRVLHVLDIHLQTPDITLEDAAKIFQREFRYKGRPINHTKIIGTTLLIKGLEYDHAIVVDAPSLSIKQLYVALTRGSKSITIISKKYVLPD